MGEGEKKGKKEREKRERKITLPGSALIPGQRSKQEQRVAPLPRYRRGPKISDAEREKKREREA